MAKLKAHGYELLRISKEKTIDPEAHTFMGETDMGPTLTVWERTTRSYRSDGHIMEKLDVRFKPSPYGNDFHSYGWKLYKKLKKGATVTPQEHASKVSASLKAADAEARPNPWVIEFELDSKRTIHREGPLSETLINR